MNTATFNIFVHGTTAHMSQLGFDVDGSREREHWRLHLWHFIQSGARLVDEAKLIVKSVLEAHGIDAERFHLPAAENEDSDKTDKANKAAKADKADNANKPHKLLSTPQQHQSGCRRTIKMFLDVSYIPEIRSGPWGQAGCSFLRDATSICISWASIKTNKQTKY